MIIDLQKEIESLRCEVTHLQSNGLHEQPLQSQCPTSPLSQIQRSEISELLIHRNDGQFVHILMKFQLININ
jgi:hypothetical protein